MIAWFPWLLASILQMQELYIVCIAEKVVITDRCSIHRLSSLPLQSHDLLHSSAPLFVSFALIPVSPFPLPFDVVTSSSGLLTNI
jgi:hypothetical protein